MGALPVIERTPVIPNSRRRAAVGLAGTVAAALAVTGLTGYTAHAATTSASVNQVQNGTFDSGTDPWWWTGNAPASVVNGQLCATVPGSTTNPWDAIIGQNDIPLINGES